MRAGGRQGREGSARLLDRGRKELPSGPADAVSPDRLVHAVRSPTEVEEYASDAMLLRGVAEGDKTAMHIMFTRHRTKVFRFIQRMVRNRAIAEDLFSQVFLDVWRSANRFENRARVTTWLFSIARLKALASMRERRHEDIDQDDVIAIADELDTPEAALDRKDRNAVLRACIDQLSPAHREIIDLIYYRDTSVAEASEMVGIPHATVKSRMFYARKQLAGLLVRAGFGAATVQTNVDEGKEVRPSLVLLPDLWPASSAVLPGALGACTARGCSISGTCNQT
jgi:RNA polymerase sigma-70 factor, ECF subfamily